MERINRSPYDSPHKGSVISKAFACHDVSQSKTTRFQETVALYDILPKQSRTQSSCTIISIFCFCYVFYFGKVHVNSSILFGIISLIMGNHYYDVIMRAMASQITSLTIVYSAVYPDPDQRKHESSASLAFVRGIHRGPVNSPHKWPVTRKIFPFDDVIMLSGIDAIWGHG